MKWENKIDIITTLLNAVLHCACIRNAFVVCPHPVLGPLLTVTMITLRILAALLRTVYTPKAYTAVVQNHFLRNNSSKPELTSTKFHTKVSAQMACSPANIWRPPPNGSKMAAKNAFSELFLTKNASFHSLSSGGFLEIWIQIVKRCCMNSFRTKFQNFSRDHLP